MNATAIGVDTLAKLDLNNNSLVVEYNPDDGSPAPFIQSKLASGRAGGAWNGNGITSTTAGTLGGLHLGRHANAGMKDDAAHHKVIAKFTVNGDANLSGKVDFDDLLLLAKNFNTQLPAAPADASAARTASTRRRLADDVL